MHLFAVLSTIDTCLITYSYLDEFNFMLNQIETKRETNFQFLFITCFLLSLVSLKLELADILS